MSEQESKTNAKAVKAVCGLMMVGGIVAGMFHVAGWVIFFVGLAGFVVGRFME